MKNNELAEYLFHQGTNFSAYDYLGCNREKTDQGEYFVFRAWAPNADRVELLSDIHGWDQPISLNKITDGGIYETKIPFDSNFFGKRYKFKITKLGSYHLKGDPYALYSVGGRDGASVIYDRDRYKWNDRSYLDLRRHNIRCVNSDFLSVPINIYEMHLGSFMRHSDGSFLTYRELAAILPSYLKAMSFTHVEIMPLQEHPFDGSWGYQVCAFYAITSRFGSPDDFKYLVDKLHCAGIGVILDFVGAHFPKDEWGLYEFDGAPLYEYQGNDRKESKMWGTRFFDLGREEIQSFLISSVFYFIRELHIDGIRFDAVASMLYLDYDRAPEEWIPNVRGTNENLEAIAFFKKLNSAIYSEHPDILMIAEESGAYGKITGWDNEDSLGFTLKWNMGFANDFYDYVSKDPLYRKYHHKALNFPITYAFDENYLLPISHDEVVHGKKSFADKMFGEVSDKLTQARLSLLFFMTFPGKKLGFMGYEFAQLSEWNYRGEIEWFMLDFDTHYSFREYVSALNYFYLQRKELWELDFSYSGFEWISCDESEKNVISFKRIARDKSELSVALNFSGAEQQLFIPSENKKMKIIFDTGNIYEGSKELINKGGGFALILPSASGVVLEDSTYIFEMDKEELF